MERLLLFGQVYRPHAAPSQQAERFVGAKLPAGIFVGAIGSGFGLRMSFGLQRHFQ
jgi:hypothetical protein